MIGAAIWYGIGLFYFALFARKRLVYSPEEAFATTALDAARRANGDRPTGD